MRIIPPPTFVPGVFNKIMACYFTCNVCPNPHRIVLCAPHARQVLDVAQPFYEGADHGEECRLCSFAEDLLKMEEPRLLSFLSQPKVLLDRVLNMGIRRTA